jgi:hypothetical protein
MLLLRGPRIRILFPAIVLLALALAAGLLLHRVSGAMAAEKHAEATAPAPIIVELFTSEGCSSCPPADALLARLQREQPVSSANIIALEEHVDYWDGLGWHDRFSSAAITARQSAYARRFHLDDNYTPQMVVDGTAQFVGNDRPRALEAISQASRTAKPTLLLIQAVMLQGDRIAGQLRLPSSLPVGSELYAALVQPMASTQVLHGENGGHTLNHVSVVRALERVPVADAGASVEFSLAIPRDLPPAGLQVVTFVQGSGQGAVLAAATSQLPSPHNPGPTTTVPKP